MNYVIGMDSGGTKTETVAVDEQGYILFREVSPGCNVLDIGFEEGERRLSAILARVKEAVPGEASALFGAFAGASNTRPFLVDVVRKYTKIPHVRMESDAICIITGTLGKEQDGCSMICGTGCSLILRIDGKNAFHIGGRGYMIDTGGSGYELGKEALRYAFRAFEGRGDATVLNELLEKRLGKELKDSMVDIYSGGRAKIASFAGLVFEGREQGDRICHQIIDQESTKLAELTWAAEKHFSGEFPVVMNGGIFTAFPDYAALVKAKASPRAKMILAEVPPVYGSVVEAFSDVGHECDEAFKQRFMADYRELKQE